MIKILYNKTMELAGHPQAIYFLAIVSFIEASFFPIPPDVMLIPMVLMHPSRAWLYALVATICSVLGGIFGYLIGAFSYEQFAHSIYTGQRSANGKFLPKIQRGRSMGSYHRWRLTHTL